jgi:hypothetical protein
MSDTQTAAPPGTQHAPSGDAETRARLMGWKPKAEFKGDDDKWVPADEFLDRGFASPAIMAERLQFMGDRMGRMERDYGTLNTKFEEAVGTINTMTTMMRSSERRAYERARSELEAERTKAVETGDTAVFSRVDKQIQELDKEAPAAPAARQTTQATPPPDPQRRTTATATDPAVQAFYQRNPWYTRDPLLTSEADMYHTGLLNTRPDLTVEQNLAEVERRLRTAYPERFGVVTPPAQQQADAGGGGDNPRRDEPGAVSPSAGGGRAARQRGTRTFANMPDESKQAYRRYKGQLAGKGEPLTEDEWANDYWSQFEEVP